MSESNASGLPPNKTEIEILNPPTPPTRVDDKAAALEESVEGLRAEFRRERFVYIFIIAALFDALLLSVAPASAAWFMVVASLVLLIGCAKWLEFPWVIAELEGWHKRIVSFWHTKTNTKPEIEP
jgi:di/tricarboxylate transporter